MLPLYYYYYGTMSDVDLLVKLTRFVFSRSVVVKVQNPILQSERWLIYQPIESLTCVI